MTTMKTIYGVVNRQALYLLYFLCIKMLQCICKQCYSRVHNGVMTFMKKRFTLTEVHCIRSSVSSHPSSVFQMVWSSAIRKEGNAGKEEDFDKVKLWFKRINKKVMRL